VNVEIVDFPETRLAMVPHRGAYHQISKAFAQLGQLAGPAGLFGPSAFMAAIYHDDPRTTPEAELRSEAAVSVQPDTELPRGLVEGRIPAGRYAKTTHVGPYEELMDVWPAFMKEGIPSSGHAMQKSGLSFELYRNTPMDTPKEKLLTELYVAVG